MSVTTFLPPPLSLDVKLVRIEIVGLGCLINSNGVLMNDTYRCLLHSNLVLNSTTGILMNNMYRCLLYILLSIIHIIVSLLELD